MKFNSYKYSQQIAQIASGHAIKGLHKKLECPMTNARMARLNRAMSFFIRKMEKAYSEDEYSNDADAMLYFIGTIHSQILVRKKNGELDYSKIAPLNGIFDIKRMNEEPDLNQTLKNFDILVEHWLSDLSYFSDRWCYSRFICFKLTYHLIIGRWRVYQYLKKEKEIQP